MEEVKLEKKLVGDKIQIIAYDVDESIALPILEEAYLYALKLQKVFNFYDESSELSKLNKLRLLKVSPELLEVIEKAVKYAKETSGAYDISIGKQILQRKSGLDITPLGGSYKDIKINGNVISLLHEDVLIDLGSIAKGYIVEKVASFLQENGIKAGLVNARGDMKLFGEKSEIIEIQHPRDNTKTLSPFEIKNLAVATSGDYNQFYGDYDKSHILGKKEIISSTVITQNAMDADVFATMFFVTDKKTREKIAKENPQVKVLLIDKNLNRKEYNGFSFLVVK